MPTHKSNDYKLSAVKYYLSHSKNQVHTCKIFGCSERDYTAYKISNSHISFIKNQLGKNKTITMDELLTKLKTKYRRNRLN